VAIGAPSKQTPLSLPDALKAFGERRVSGWTAAYTRRQAAAAAAVAIGRPKLGSTTIGPTKQLACLVACVSLVKLIFVAMMASGGGRRAPRQTSEGAR
jgi:hypothetical protein